MVKSIAEQAGVNTPGFFAYLLKYALPILIPLMIVISLLFFSRWRGFASGGSNCLFSARATCAPTVNLVFLLRKLAGLVLQVGRGLKTFYPN